MLYYLYKNLHEQSIKFNYTFIISKNKDYGDPFDDGKIINAYLHLNANDIASVTEK